MIKQNENNATLLIDSQYFGSVDYYKLLNKFSNIVIEQYETYQKMSFRNRCMVAGSNGVVGLSVPLEKGRGQRELMKDVRISYSDNWQLQHWRTIESCYSRAPFFEFYRDGVWQLLQQKETFLLDLNMATLSWLQKVLKMPGSVSLTNHYQKSCEEGVTDKRNSLLPKQYQLSYTGPRYTQVFEDRIGFQPNLSILDLLFCSGPETGHLVKTTF